MMKSCYKQVGLLALILVLAAPGRGVTAQDNTLVVEWFDESADTLITNPLYRAIVADTLADGSRVEGRVYKLRQGGFYYITETIDNSGFPLRIEGEPGDPSDPFANPPMLQVDARSDGSTPGKMFNIRGDFSLKNVIVNGKTTLGGLNYEIFDARNEGVRIEFDHVVFEYAQWGIMGVYGKNSDLFITNSHFRNFLAENQPWGGRGFSVWADVDTIWVENNTFHDIGGFTAQVEGGSANLFWFNHNTIVNNGRELILGSWLRNAYITNNLILNGYWQGEAYPEISADRRASEDEQYAGMFAINDLPASYGLNAQRNIAIANNSFFMEAEMAGLQAADNDTFPVRKQPLLSVKTQKLFDANPNMVVTGNFFDEHDPGFTTYADNHPERFAFIQSIRRGETATMYYWDPGREDDNASVQWPLPEDLTYSNSTLKSAGIGGYPLGNLNWYPDVKATWEANRAAQQEAILGLLGEPIEVTYFGTIEAEDGQVGGGAEVAAVSDENRLRARIEASGDIVWSGVSVPAGTYDVAVSLRTWWNDGAADRATNLVVNDNSVAFPRGGTGDQFNTAVISAVEMAETNTVKLGKNWGYLEYEYLKVLEAGTENVVATLWPGEAELVDGGTYQCPQGGLCLSGDGYVDTKSGGSVTVPQASDGTGNYVVRITYVLAAGSTSGSIAVNGGAGSSVDFAGDAGSLQQVDVTVMLDGGDNTIAIEAPSGGVWMDRIDLYLVGSTTGTSNEDLGELADQFRLEQNYPNPFNPSTLINFAIPAASDVQLSVYNLLGQRVAVLAEGRFAAGTHSVRFDGAGLASGMYLYRLQAGEFVSQKKMMLVK